MHIKNLLPIVALLSIPAASLLAAERPCGILGVDAVSASYTYYNANNGYYHEPDYNVWSTGIGINKNVYDGSRFGVDLSGRYYYVGNVSMKDEFDYSMNAGEVGTTVFLKGVISPFVSTSVYYRDYKTDFKNLDREYSGHSWDLEGKIGVEAHLLEGLSARAYVATSHSCAANTPKNNTRFTLECLYWFTARAGLSLSESYTTFEHIDRYATAVTLYFHF